MSGSDVIRTDDDLKHWLEVEEWYMSSHTREWLQRTDPREASDALARVAEGADREPNTAWSAIATNIAMSGFAPGGAIAGPGPGTRKAGVRAALMLEKAGDPRAVAPLARAFAAPGSRQTQYQGLIEEALARALARAEAISADDVADVLDLARRAWSSRPGRDLAPLHADIVASALPLLAPHPSAAPLLRAIAADDSRGAAARGANRKRVREVAVRQSSTTIR